MRFVVFVATSLAALVAGDEVLACPPVPPPACDCMQMETRMRTLNAEQEQCLQSKVKELATKDDALRNAGAEHEKAMVKVRAELEQFRKASSEWQQRSVELEKQVNGLQANAVKAKEADVIGRQLEALEKTHREVLEKNAADIATYKSAINDLQSKSQGELNQCQVKHDSLQKDHQAYKISVAEYEAKYAELTAKAEEYKVAMQEMKRELDPLVTRIYSTHHIEYAARHLYRVGSAFVGSLNRRVTNFLGPDFVKLVKLQGSVWGRRAQFKAKELSTPLWFKAKEQYVEKFKAHCDPILVNVLEFKDKQLILAQHFWNRFLVLTERMMDRIVRNLSTVDPTIGEVFGYDFTDRCFAFAFILGCLKLVSAILQWPFGVFIQTPFYWIFGIGKSKAKKGKKAASKASTVVKGKGTKLPLGKEATKTDPKEAAKASPPSKTEPKEAAKASPPSKTEPKKAADNKDKVTAKKGNKY